MNTIEVTNSTSTSMITKTKLIEIVKEITTEYNDNEVRALDKWQSFIKENTMIYSWVQRVPPFVLFGCDKQTYYHEGQVRSKTYMMNYFEMLGLASRPPEHLTHLKQPALLKYLLFGFDNTQIEMFDIMNTCFRKEIILYFDRIGVLSYFY